MKREENMNENVCAVTVSSESYGNAIYLNLTSILDVWHNKTFILFPPGAARALCFDRNFSWKLSLFNFNDFLEFLHLFK